MERIIAPSVVQGTFPRGSSLDRLVRDRLASRGVRFTRARRTVVQALRRAPGPQSAGELHRRLRGRVPISSLYRTLTVLEEAGVLAPHHGARDVTRYELDEWLSGHHHHLVCPECGAVEDIELQSDSEHALEGLVVRVAAGRGLDVLGHTLEIEGLCESCAQ